MEIRIKDKYYDFSFDMRNRLIFVGANLDLKYKLFQRIKRFGQGGKYDELEMNLYGEEGISISYSESKLNPRKQRFLTISSMDDIKREITLEKKTLLYENIYLLKDDLEITRQIQLLNDNLLSIENLLNTHYSTLFNNLQYYCQELTFDHIINKQTSVQYYNDTGSLPFYALSASELVDEFLVVLKQYIEQSGQEVWISIYNPEEYLDETILDLLLSSLDNIANETSLLKTIIFHRWKTATYASDDIGSVIISLDTFQQLPEFNYFRKSIERNYPIPLEIDNNDLSSQFFRICLLLGSKDFSSALIQSKDMILLKVLEILLEDRTDLGTLETELSDCEKAFLISR